MGQLSFGLQEHLHWMAAYLGSRVELYGQQGEGVTEAEFFLKLLYEFHEGEMSDKGSKDST